MNTQASCDAAADEYVRRIYDVLPHKLLDRHLTRLGFQHVEHANHPHGAVLPSDHVFQLNRTA